MTALQTIRLELVDQAGAVVHDETFPFEGETLLGFEKGLTVGFQAGAVVLEQRVLIRVRFDPPLYVLELDDDDLGL